MVTGWNNIGGSWYYLEPSGAMATGWVITNGKWYYLASSGKMLTSTTTPDGYRVGHDGSWIR
jgi:mannosyl-glycoprotein endo-beta-N-acetylglucosaminidase